MHRYGSSDSCIHNGHSIHVRAISIGGAFGYVVDIRMPDGTPLPPIKDDDHVFDTPEIALAEGISVGKRVAEN